VVLFSGVLLMLVGVGMAFFWFSYILKGGVSEGTHTLAGENYITLHITAELLTAVLCLSGGLALALDLGWGLPVGLFACGMLAYTGINSLAWIKNTRAISIVFIAAFLVSVSIGAYLLVLYLK